jgi:hypothetical protein
MPKKKGSRASGPKVAQRVAEILRIRLDGAAFHDCVAFAKEKRWGVSERQVGRYIATADDQLAANQEKKRRRLIGLHLARREALFARAVNGADYRTALAILADAAKMQGLYASDQEMREMARLAVEQGRRIDELESMLNAARRNQVPADEKRPPA